MIKIYGSPMAPHKHNVEANLRLCLWLLDQTRVHLPRSHRHLARKLYEIEAELNDGSACGYDRVHGDRPR